MNRFNITLAAKTPEDDNSIQVGLQMLVYLNNNMIAFKTDHSDWKEEIHHEFATSLFLTEFKINIVMSEHNFHVAINNRPCSTVTYSLPLNILNTIKMNGHLDYVKQVDHRKYFPYAWPPLQLSEDGVDFSNDQPMSFEPGHVMVLNAQFFGNTNGRVVMQLKNARDSLREELHLSIRFDTQTFLRNSKTTRCKDKRTSIEYLG